MADVICPNCNESCHETTDKYDPDKTPHGAMFALKGKYRSNGWSSFTEEEGTVFDNLYCPSCGGLYREGNPGRVRVVGWERPVDVLKERKEAAISDYQHSVVDSLSRQRPTEEVAPVKNKGGRPRKIR